MKKGGRAIPCNLEKRREGNDCEASLPPRAVAALLAPLVQAPTPCRCGARCCHTAVRLRGPFDITRDCLPCLFLKHYKGLIEVQGICPVRRCWTRTSWCGCAPAASPRCASSTGAHARTLMRTRARSCAHAHIASFMGRIMVFLPDWSTLLNARPLWKPCYGTIYCGVPQLRKHFVGAAGPQDHKPGRPSWRLHATRVQ